MEATPTRAEFRRLWRAGGAPPVWRETLADCETPVSAFRKIDTAPGGEGGDAFLLESVEGGEVWGRHSILGASIGAAVVATDGGAAIVEKGRVRPLRASDPLGALREALRPRSRSATTAGDPLARDLAAVAPPPPFRGGAVGWLAYDAVRHYARVEMPPWRRGERSAGGSTEGCFLLPDAWMVFDRLRSRIALVADTSFHAADSDPDEVWDRAARRLSRMEAALRRPLRTRGAGPRRLSLSPFDVDDPAFGRMVERAQEYVRAGDVIQVVLSRRRLGRFDGDPLDVYRALRLVNPSPYMFLLRAGGTLLAGSSPEALVRVDAGGRLVTRPIAGTRPRGTTPEEDARREAELLADEKERAEHLMLVDLGRNDLGRVARAGSVRVPSFMRVERYSHVMHLVSDVTGELRGDRDPFDAVASVFPAGTLSGAPKVRAMQIVSELEARRRGVYGGLVGWFGLDGRADTCIAIRTVELTVPPGARARTPPGSRGPAAGGGWRFRVQAGAGIVFDSDPAAEAAETRAKAEGVLAALDLAARGLR